MTRTKLNKLTLQGAGSLIALTFAGGVAFAGDEKNFDIDAQPLAKALLEFNEQSGLTVAAPRNLVEDKRSPAVRGEMDPDEALDKILSGSGLKSTELSSGGYTITLVSAEADEARTFRVVQLDQEDDVLQSGPGRNLEDDEFENDVIIVTGTNINGVGPTGSDMIVFDREDIDNTGLATTQQILQTLPQAFGGGPAEDTISGREVGSNIAFSAGVNLRGLNAGSTLVLVNGRRQAGAGTQAAFIDVSSIPASAIERIEVLPDGASAIYGSDAIGGVVNIILRDDYDGAETRARFGTVTEGSADEYLASQLLGASWDTGNILASYEYYKRGSLAHSDRDFAADGDLTSFGGDNFNEPFGNPGTILNPFTLSAAFAIPAGQDGTSLTPAALVDLSVNPDAVNLQNSFDGRDLLPSQERHSGFLSLRQVASERVELSTEWRYSNRKFTRSEGPSVQTLFVPSSNPFFVDPFGFGFSFVGYNIAEDVGTPVSSGETETLNGVIASRIDAGAGWRVDVHGAYGREESFLGQTNVVDQIALSFALADPNPLTAFNPFGEGSNSPAATIDGIRGFSTIDAVSDIWTANVTANGPLFSIPGGDVSLAFGGDFRHEGLETSFLSSSGSTVGAFDRNIYAVFGEVFIPLVGEANAAPGMRRLEVSAAGRFEDYSDFGSSANPKIGAVWSPFEGLLFRGSFSTSFKAPGLRQLDETGNTAFITPLIDPTSPIGFTSTLLLLGNNSDLREETATSWTAGFEFTPPQVEGFAAELTYFDIDFDNRIDTPNTIANAILGQEDRFGSVITRSPTQAQLDAACGGAEFLGDPATCVAGFVGAITDFRLNNAAETKVSGLDFNARYGFETNFGTIDLSVNGTYLLDFQEGFGSAQPLEELVATVNHPIDFRMRNNISWSYEGFGVSVFVNYADSYRDDVSIPERSIDAWTTVDLNVSYRTGDRAANKWLRGLTASVSVINLFDEDPPFVNTLGGYDRANADPLNRFISFELTKAW